MPTFHFKLTLLSEATFGRGDGVAGLVDTEIEHDERGFPYLHGRGVKGLFTAQCADILGALQSSPAHDKLEQAADILFGKGGSDLHANGKLHFGTARLPKNLCDAISAIDEKKLSRHDVLEALTTIRRQTKINDDGAAEENTLRATRVLVSGLIFESEITAECPLKKIELTLLAACAEAIRSVGSNRARGLGRVRAELMDEAGNDVTAQGMTQFAREVLA